MNLAQVPYLPMPYQEPEIDVRSSATGAIYLESAHKRVEAHQSIPHLLRRTASLLPNNVCLGEKDADGNWHTISYDDFDKRSDSVAQHLLSRSGEPNSVVLIISENSIAHAILMMAAMKARLPVCSVSAQYALLDPALSKLREVAERVKPSLVFAECEQRYANALNWFKRRGIECVVGRNADKGSNSFSTMQATLATDEVERSIGLIEPSTVAKLLFTSGSTGSPKCVVHTEGSLCSQVSGLQSILKDTHPGQVRQTSLQWMPWSHVSAGTIAFHEALMHGGAIYIDDGKPTPELFSKTIENLRDLPTSVFGSAPLGLSWLATALEKDEGLQKTFFSKLEAIAYGGSALPTSVAERIQGLAVKELGHRVPIVSMYGSTEAQGITATYWPTSLPGVIGLPLPGVKLKLTPNAGKTEVRLRGGTLMQEYLGDPQATADCYDDEGYFGMGDAAKFADQAKPLAGLVFDGRISEDFKLLSGTWVSTASVKAQLLAGLGRQVRDLVICGENRTSLLALAWPDPQLADDIEQTCTDLNHRLNLYNEHHRASSRSVPGVILMSEPASLAEGEINDKGYINTRRLQELRAKLIETYYQAEHMGVILEDELRE